MIALRRIDLRAPTPEADSPPPDGAEMLGYVDAGVKGECVQVPGDAPGSVATVAFVVDGETACFDAMPGDVELLLQRCDPWRTLRMVCVGAFVFDPISFTWYYAILPQIVPGHIGHLTAGQMTKKILYDVLVYGGVVASISITANAALQSCSADIQAENERLGVSRCGHVCNRIQYDLPRLYCYAIMLSIPADIPVFLWVPAKWQAACFKFGDAVFMLIVSYVVNSDIHPVADTQDWGPPRRNRAAIPAPEEPLLDDDASG